MLSEQKMSFQEAPPPSAKVKKSNRKSSYKNNLKELQIKDESPVGLEKQDPEEVKAGPRVPLKGDPPQPFQSPYKF